MFGIEVFCGLKYGGWFPLSARFASEAAAKARAERDTITEMARGVTPLLRRVRRPPCN